MRDGKDSFPVIVMNLKLDLDGNYKDSGRNIEKKLLFVGGK